MSKALLNELNGSNNGKFRSFLDTFNGEPRICWYPSADKDFRDMLYFSPQFALKRPVQKTEPASPDIFLHTDYFPFERSCFLNTSTVHIDERTSVTVRSVEELPRLDLPVSAGLVLFNDASSATGRIFYLEVDVRSTLLGDFSYPLVYACVENTAFIARKVLPSAGRFSHIAHIRYGGGSSTGAWFLNILNDLKCEVFATDGHHAMGMGDERAINMYPALAGPSCADQYEQIRLIDAKSWSCHGDVSWNIHKSFNDFS